MKTFSRREKIKGRGANAILVGGTIDALGQSTSDNVVVSPWTLPDDMILPQINANLEARGRNGSDVVLALDIYSWGINLNNFSLTVDFTEDPGVSVDTTKSTHSNPYTADNFAGDKICYYLKLNMKELPQTVVIIVKATSSQGNATVRIPTRVESIGKSIMAY